MTKINKIKFYTHHKRSFDLKIPTSSFKSNFWSSFISFIFHFFYYIGVIVLSISNFLKNTLIKVCFAFGSLILNFFKNLYQDINKTNETLPKRFEKIFQKQFMYSLSIFIIIAIIGNLFINSLQLVAKAINIKNTITKTAFIGNRYLNKAKSSLSNQDFNKAENNFNLAYKTFKQGETNIKQSGEALNQFLNIIPQKKDADRIIKSASLVAEAGTNFINIEKEISYLKLTSAGINSQEKPTSEVLNEIQRLINISSENINNANNYVNEVNEKSLPQQYKAQFLDLKTKLNIASLAINNFKSIFEIGYALIKGDKKILLLFENNNELRATGGFMGTFGALSIKDGSIKSINVSSIYDLDGQLTETIKPPQPILNLSDKWYLRDSNWFANFPESAKKISDFYEKEGGETPDIIVALTPNIIIDLLKITGPIKLDRYGVTLNSDNFVEITQVATTLSNELPTNSPKQILADLVPILLQKINELEPESYANIIASLQNNLNEKQIAIYSRDAQVQKKLTEFNWTGNLKETDRDYLSVVSSNLGGTKTDLNIEQELQLHSTISNKGKITNELTIIRTNKLPKLDKTYNLSFIRAYLPLGSKIISNSGFDYKNLEYPENLNYKDDSDILQWQKSSVKDMLTGSIIGEESSKTFIGNWLKLEGGETKTIKITYELPFNLDSTDKLSLMLQKQLGTGNQKFSWYLSFPEYSIAWKNFDPTTLETSSLNSDIILDKDYFLGLVIQKR